MPPPGHPTRQQLDELEALMQRMLALPVNHLEEELNGVQDSSTPATPSANPRVEIISPLPVPTTPANEGQAKRQEFVAARPEQQSELSELVGLRPSQSPSSRPVKKERDESPARSRSSTATKPRISTVELTHQVATETPRPSMQSLGETERPIVAGWLLPLFWCNRAFDLATVLLGPLGRWLRGPGGRALLGWCGLLLLVLAAAWMVLVGMGWTW
jgi:hypothetical protein